MVDGDVILNLIQDPLGKEWMVDGEAYLG